MKLFSKNLSVIISIILVCLLCLNGCGKSKNKPQIDSPTKVPVASGNSVFDGNPNASKDTNTSGNDTSSQKDESNTPSNNDTSSTVSVEDETSTRPEKTVKTYKLINEFEMPNWQRLYFNDSISGKRLPYSIYLPQNYSKNKKYPVLLFLHGAGERGDDNRPTSYLEPMFNYNSDLVKNAIIISPQCPVDGWWEIDENGKEKGWLGAAWHLLKEIESTYSCDLDRIYVMGLSMGGYGTWSLLERFGDHFAAGVPICGWGDSSYANSLAQIPIWIYHGTDDPTVSIKSSEEMYNAITKAGGNKIHFTRLPGVDHTSWPYAFRSRELLSWMFSQNKTTNPKGDHQITPYLKVTDPNGNTIISELDTTFISFTLFDGAEQVELTLTDNAVKKLTTAYKKYKGKNFDIYYGSNKILTFTPTKAPTDNLFYINGVFDSSNYHDYFNRVTENAETWGEL